MSEFSGALEFYTNDDGQIELTVRLGNKSTSLWAKVLSTMAIAFETDAPTLLQAARAVTAGTITVDADDEDDDIIEGEEALEETNRTH